MILLSSYEGVVYNRNLVAVNTKLHSGQQRFTMFTVGFCGKLYSGIVEPVYTVGSINKPRCFSHMKTHYSFDSFKFPMLKQDERERRRSYEKFFSVVEDRSLFIKYNAPIFILISDWSGMFKLCAHSLTPVKKPADKSVLVDVPLHVSCVFTDYVPTLKLFNFDTVFAANNAYMEVESFINGVLCVEHKVIPEMSDVVKRDQHGFDVNSFKKQSKR